MGHSLGGLTVLLFASSFPDEMAGLIFVDSSNPYRYDGGPSEEVLPGDTAAQRIHREMFMSDTITHLQSPEGFELQKSFRAAAQVTDLGDLPVYVLTAGNRSLPDTIPASFTAWLVEDNARGHGRLAMMSTRSRHVTVDGAGHFVQNDRPEAVVGAVDWVLSAVRSR
jgi:pimeloyl-ACP methyl ester carboxylesterase